MAFTLNALATEFQLVETCNLEEPETLYQVLKGSGEVTHVLRTLLAEDSQLPKPKP